MFETQKPGNVSPIATVTSPPYFDFAACVVVVAMAEPVSAIARATPQRYVHRERLTVSFTYLPPEGVTENRVTTVTVDQCL